MLLAFSPEQLCSDLSRQIESLLTLNWQVLKVLILKFQASALDHHHLFVNLSCKSASKPLNAQYDIALEQEVIAAGITIALVILYLHASDVHQHSTFTETEQRLCFEALTSAVGLLQNVSAYKTWIPLSSCWRVSHCVTHKHELWIWFTLSYRRELIATCPYSWATGRNNLIFERLIHVCNW